ncbi:MAG: hypothetical protein ACRDG4_02595 [Chloroflexota bacterium]
MESIALRRGAASESRAIRDRGASILMIVSAIGALYALASAIGTVTSAGAATQQVEVWRMFGFAMFAGVFVLLAVWPRRYPGLWELVIINKAALTVAEVVLISNDATNAQSAAIADGILTVFLLAAYVLSRGWTSWSTRRLTQQTAKI